MTALSRISETVDVRRLSESKSEPFALSGNKAIHESFGSGKALKSQNSLPVDIKCDKAPKSISPLTIEPKREILKAHGVSETDDITSPRKMKRQLTQRLKKEPLSPIDAERRRKLFKRSKTLPPSATNTNFKKGKNTSPNKQLPNISISDIINLNDLYGTCFPYAPSMLEPSTSDKNSENKNRDITNYASIPFLLEILSSGANIRQSSPVLHPIENNIQIKKPSQTNSCSLTPSPTRSEWYKNNQIPKPAIPKLGSTTKHKKVEDNTKTQNGTKEMQLTNGEDQLWVNQEGKCDNKKSGVLSKQGTNVPVIQFDRETQTILSSSDSCRRPSIKEGDLIVEAKHVTVNFNTCGVSKNTETSSEFHLCDDILRINNSPDMGNRKKPSTLNLDKTGKEYVSLSDSNIDAPEVSGKKSKKRWLPKFVSRAMSPRRSSK